MFLMYTRMSILLSAALCCTACSVGTGWAQRAAPTPIPIALPTTFLANDAVPHTVARGELDQVERFPGKVALAVQEELFFRQSGRVAKLHVQNGELVVAGQVIAELDTRLLEVDLDSALLALAVAQEQQSRAERDLATARQRAELNLAVEKLQLADLLGDAPNAVESSQRTIYEHRVELAQLALDSIHDEINPALNLNIRRAELAIDRLKASLLDAQIAAPFAGKVRFIMLEADKQMTAQAYEPIARLIDPNSLQIESNLTRAQLELLQEGMTVSMRTVSAPDAPIPGIIDALPAPYGTGASPLVQISIDDEVVHSLSEGSSVTVDVALQHRENALLIPADALYGFKEQYYVIVQDGTARREVAVDVGIQSDEYVEILAGLTAGQVVFGRK